jgi:hypothetical protein
MVIPNDNSSTFLLRTETLKIGDYSLSAFVSNNYCTIPVHWRVHVSRATSVELRRDVPTVFELCQNYPNPFNPCTAIQFSIPKSGFATLRLFNILGEEVTMLVSEQLNPGTYTREWDASRFPSGVYFYRLQIANFVQTKKLILLR